MTKPRQAVRRFDVFAEYSRLEGLKDDLPGDEAQGYGLWLAKLVAARRFGKKTGADRVEDREERGKDSKEKPREKWRTLSDEPQTDEMFQKEIISRMGEEFYEEVFSPAIEEAFNSGQKYTEIRDKIRKDWKP